MFHSILAYHMNSFDEEIGEMDVAAQNQSRYLISSQTGAITVMAPTAEFRPDYGCSTVFVLTVASVCVILGMLIGFLVHLLS
jgi:hypothetical protein